MTEASAVLGWEAWLTASILLLVVIAMVREWAPPDILMLSGLIILVAAGILPVGSAFAGFADPNLLAIAALLIVAAAVRNCGALAFLYPLMMPRSSALRPALLRIMIPSASISAFMNNTPIVAILAPLVQRWSAREGIPPSRMLIPLTYATTLGGMITILGTSTNLLVVGLLVKNGYRPLGMWELAWVGLPVAAVGILYLVVASSKLLRDTGTGSPFDRSEIRTYQFELRVPEGSPLDGVTIEEAGLRALEGAFLAHIHRDGDLIGPVAPEQGLREGDVLGFVGNPKVLDELLRSLGLARAIDAQPGNMPRPHLPLFEVVLAADSSLVGKSLKETDFRERFEAVVLGIQRRGSRIEGSLGRTPLEAGDLLLVEARPSFEERALQSGEFYLAAPLERSTVAARQTGRPALLILLAMVIVASFEWVPLVTAAIAAAILMILLGAITPLDARRNVDLSILVVIGAGIGIGEAIQSTGLAAVMAEAIVRSTIPFGPVVVLAAVYLTTNLLTEFLSNNAAAVLVFPVGMAAAEQIGANPIAFAVAIAIAASAGFATPIGYQTNLMVMSAGGYRFSDYLKIGIPLDLLVMAIAIPIIARVWL